MDIIFKSTGEVEEYADAYAWANRMLFISADPANITFVCDGTCFVSDDEPRNDLAKGIWQHSIMNKVESQYIVIFSAGDVEKYDEEERWSRRVYHLYAEGYYYYIIGRVCFVENGECDDADFKDMQDRIMFYALNID